MKLRSLLAAVALLGLTAFAPVPFLNRKPPAVFDIFSAQPTSNLLDKNPMTPELQRLTKQWSHFPTAYGNAALYLQTHNPRFHD